MQVIIWIGKETAGVHKGTWRRLSTGGWVFSHFSPAQVKSVRDNNGLKEKSKGKTKEGASEPLTMGDLQSHRKMFNLIKNTFPEITVSPSAKINCWVFLPDLCPVPGSVWLKPDCLYLQVNSEEHDNVVDKVTWNQDIPADILDKIKAGRVVPVESVTVWIDPLDATQEYTGVYVALKSFSNAMHWTVLSLRDILCWSCTKRNSRSDSSSQIKVRGLTRSHWSANVKNTVFKSGLHGCVRVFQVPVHLYNTRLNKELSMLSQTPAQYLLIVVFSVLSTGLL